MAPKKKVSGAPIGSNSSLTPTAPSASGGGSKKQRRKQKSKKQSEVEAEEEGEQSSPIPTMDSSSSDELSEPPTSADAVLVIDESTEIPLLGNQKFGEIEDQHQ